MADETAPSVDVDGGNCGGATTGDGAAPVASDNARPGKWAVGNGAGGVIVVSNVFLWFARARDESNFGLSPILSFG